MRWQSFIIGLFCLGMSHSAVAAEQILNLNYQVDCPTLSPSGFPGLTGSVNYLGRKIRINLFKYEHQKSVLLAFSDAVNVSQLEFSWDTSSECQLSSFNPSIRNFVDDGSVKSLAFKYAPYFYVRGDQIANRSRDVAMGMTYTLGKAESGNRLLTYTIFFSNETVKGWFSTSKLASMLTYGRRTDIEWVSDVELGPNGEVVKRRYQGGIIGGMGHSTKNFSGKFLPGTEHPILYDIALHNVFSDHGEATEGYHLIPEDELREGEARESWMWARPWTFDVSDRELLRGNKLLSPSEDYLYVLMKGSKTKVKLQLLLNPVSAQQIIVDYKRLRNFLGGHEAYSAILLKNDDEKRGGTFSLAGDFATSSIEEIRFFRLERDLAEGFRPLEVTAQFHCDQNFSCRY